MRTKNVTSKTIAILAIAKQQNTVCQLMQLCRKLLLEMMKNCTPMQTETGPVGANQIIKGQREEKRERENEKF